MTLDSLVEEAMSTPWIGAAAIVIAVLLAYLVFAVPPRRIPKARRRYGAPENPSALRLAADASTRFIGRVLSGRGRLEAMSRALDLAGIRRSVPEFILLVGAASLCCAAIGVVLGGFPVAVMLGVLAASGAFLFVSFRVSKRRDDFADQLDDLVQLLGSNMRAGHSVLQALDSVSRELEEPGATEVARVVNEVRVGRDLGEALDEAAERMDSEDFRWISQAIAIHRRVGGNLAEVLDTVGETIRERNQIRRQVKALAAEGKLSAYVLVALPILVALVLLIFNPDYLALLTQSVLGYVMILVAVVLLVVGSWWMSKIVKIRF